MCWLRCSGVWTLWSQCCTTAVRQPPSPRSNREFRTWCTSRWKDGRWSGCTSQIEDEWFFQVWHVTKSKSVKSMWVTKKISIQWCIVPWLSQKIKKLHCIYQMNAIHPPSMPPELTRSPAGKTSAGWRNAGTAGMEGCRVPFICMFCLRYSDTELVKNLQSLT